MAADPPGAVVRPSVFISYARDPDRVLARELAVALRALGFAVSLDLDGLQPGETWAPRILDLVRDAAVFIVLLSRPALDSKPCRDEWQVAIDERKRLLPIRTGNLSDDAIPAALQDSQRIDHVGADRSFADLVCAIDSALRRDADWHREQNYLAALERDWRSQPGDARSLFLLSRRQAERARRTLERRGDRLPEPTTAVLAFLAASEAEHRRRDQRKTAAIIVGVGLVLATGGVGFAMDQAREKTLTAEVRIEAAEVATGGLPATSASAPEAVPAQPAPVPPVPQVAPPSAELLRSLTAQFSQASRRAASDSLQRLYLAAPAGSPARQAIVDATIAELQTTDGRSAYRVNLYVFVTLGRMPGWTADARQRATVDRAMQLYATDPTYRWWTARTVQAAAP